MGNIKTPEEYTSSDNQTKLNDAWWAVCGPDAGKAILQNGIPLLGPDWKPLPNRHTTPEVELGALPQNFAVVLAAIAALSTKLDKIPAAVLTQTVALSDGSVPNVAAVLDRILSKAAPAGSAPAAVDIEALVARLKAELPAATIELLATKLTTK